ncbi:ORF6N domain-containing protein [Chitinophaga sp. 212800010-3]|uniref:ORF6N domain-containing protein n=1 Tax=unclassified Chitinophaga TaxID=2619133 RepID=UPI002DED18C0|nr:ORF6N domain-containing protein [Chitinophaga sp. 212800010-3]
MNNERKEVMLTDEILISKIYYVRGHKIMLDRDLAELYDVKPIRLREQVKRNMSRFPENFMFQLTDEEVENMVSQFAIPSKKHLGGYFPYVFTEHGVLMLANVLRSDRAIQVSIRIIEIFVKMREMLSTHKDVLLKLEQLERKSTDHDAEIQLIFKYLKELLTPLQEPLNKIGFTRHNQ